MSKKGALHEKLKKFSFSNEQYSCWKAGGFQKLELLPGI
jgi:hypothetical protein